VDHPQISRGIEVWYGKVAVQSGRPATSLKLGKIERQLLLYELSIVGKIDDLE